MKQRFLVAAIKLATAGALAGSLAACGGGGGGSGSAANGSATDGSASSGTSVGAVTGFGSVYVNSTRFNTDGSVNSDDGIERETQLEKGMILKVRGRWDDDGRGEADRLDYDDSVRGPLEAAEWDDVEGQGSLTVAGQTIEIDDQTVFKGATPIMLAAAASDYRVRVSAWRLQDGRFRASYVGAKSTVIGDNDFDDLNEVEIEGAITALDTALETFEIEGIVVDYGVEAEFDDDLERDDLEDGLVVEVEGHIEGGILIAKEIDDEDDLFDDDDDVEIAGAVNGDYAASARQFQLNGITVQVNGSTEFDDGLRESDLADGLLVKVEGSFRNGVLVAEEIEPRDGDAELDGIIESKSGDDLIVSGVRVMITGNTLIEDDDDDDGITMRTRDIEQLMVNDNLEIEGIQRSGSGGYLEALKIERDDDVDDDYELEGRVTEITGNSITVLGLTMAGTSSDFSGIRVGDEVEVDFERDEGGRYIVIDIEKDD